MHGLGDVRLGSFVDTAEMSLKLTSDSRQAEEWSFLKWLLAFEQGYQALTWNDGKITYWAVSDAAAEELKTFVSLFQAAAES